MKIDKQKLAELQVFLPEATEELIRMGEKLLPRPQDGILAMPIFRNGEGKAVRAYIEYRDLEIRAKMAKAKAEGRTLRTSEIEIR
ncbi:MAG: hypothetical protein EBR82_42565 [Caulobacteraceae bacterium]|nr:hypothetical protein [Caulobacteraceae bacterium]NDG19883.1 hypothetical protein [Betaproteobacteria bacterium]